MQPNWTRETAPKGKGKCYHKYHYTVADIVRLTGKDLQSVRNDIYSNKKLKLKDLWSVSKYICLARRKNGNKKKEQNKRTM